MLFLIRPIGIPDIPIINEIGFASKSHWNYPKEYMDIWKDELTITPENLPYKMIYCGIWDEEIIGFYSLADYQKKFYHV